MKWCVSCILPFGSLDVIRIVHPNGRLQEIRGTLLIQASDLMKSHPNHVLKTPSFMPSSDGTVRRKIVTVLPEAELQRGKIYFLLPAKTRSASSTRKKKREFMRSNVNSVTTKRFVYDRYFSEIMAGKVPVQRNGRRRRGGVWRPRLESICEV